ncbi:transposon Tf2-1 polyprotein isoform X1 [Cucumis melo var. makuwa]|uniref:Transposon Tf2-1 polyprotein isoform X1 n=1 Tax=Cucumis melo var. makuwa TaxID=1194695 RepID=A0A5D3B8E5_CUCMM|nr:transposon Tf2-1 polyprotein isoform X1 [Cucumis melo var. makuwa]
MMESITEKMTESVMHKSAIAKGKEKETSTSKLADTIRNAEEDRIERKTDNDELSTDRSKFKKVEMPVFTREDPTNGTILGKFLRIKQETSIEEYRNLFDKLFALLSDILEKVVKDTLINGLLPSVRAEVAFFRPQRLVEMMQVAQLVENGELIRNETKLNGYSGGKYNPQASTTNKPTTGNPSSENKGNTAFPIRTITLRNSNANEVRKEANYRRLPDAEFQAWKKKGLCVSLQWKILSRS